MDNMMDILAHGYPIFFTTIIAAGLFIFVPGLYALYWRNNIIKQAPIRGN
jgi:hypothetical protein